MRNRTSFRWLEVFSGLVASICALTFAPQAFTKESVRAELIRLQNLYGLTLAWVDNRVQTKAAANRTTLDDGVQAVSFEKRVVIPLKNSLQAFRLEGFSFSGIPRLATNDMCWSHDGRKLAATMLHPGRASLEIFTLGTKATQPIDSQVDQRMHFTSQCWSPDDKQVAYETEGSAKVYRFGGDTPSTRVLGKGTDVTWAPDGEWIAFRDRDTYYAVHPDGNGRKKLFQKGGAVSALYWSPDSRIVAYVRELGFLQGGWLDAEVNQLRVRRLEDGSEDRLCPDSVDWFANYQWIRSSELMKSPGSE
jgi:hypothetical protein